jgi:hypothetical protein
MNLCKCGHFKSSHLFFIDRRDISPCQECYHIKKSSFEYKIGYYDLAAKKFPLCTMYIQDNLSYLEQLYESNQKKLSV